MLFASRMIRDVPVLRNDVAACLGRDGRFSSSSGAQFSSSLGPSVSFAVIVLVAGLCLWPRHIVIHCISHEYTVAVSHGFHGCSVSFGEVIGISSIGPVGSIARIIVKAVVVLRFVLLPSPSRRRDTKRAPRSVARIWSDAIEKKSRMPMQNWEDFLKRAVARFLLPLEGVFASLYLAWSPLSHRHLHSSPPIKPINRQLFRVSLIVRETACDLQQTNPSRLVV